MCGEEWDKLSFLAVDVEEVEGLRDVDEIDIRSAIDRTVDFGQRPVIYTGYGFWKDHMGNTSSFSGIGLWDANYDGNKEFSLVRRYGGWTQDTLMGKQYQGSTDLIGITVDFNTFKTEFVKRRK